MDLAADARCVYSIKHSEFIISNYSETFEPVSFLIFNLLKSYKLHHAFVKQLFGKVHLFMEKVNGKLLLMLSSVRKLPMFA